MNTNSKCKENLLSLKIFAKSVLYLEHDLFAFFKNDKTSSNILSIYYQTAVSISILFMCNIVCRCICNSQCFKSLDVFIMVQRIET